MNGLPVWKQTPLIGTVDHSSVTGLIAAAAKLDALNSNKWSAKAGNPEARQSMGSVRPFQQGASRDHREGRDKNVRLN